MRSSSVSLSRKSISIFAFATFAAASALAKETERREVLREEDFDVPDHLDFTTLDLDSAYDAL